MPSNYSAKTFRSVRSRFRLGNLGSLALLLLAPSTPAAFADYVTFGNGYGSKWDNPEFGTPAIVTWGFMPDGTTVDSKFGISSEISGGSKISQMQATYDATYGAGAYLTAIKNALATWEPAANITFVGPISDPHPGAPLPSGATGATTPDIRIGAFNAVAGSGFSFVGGVGFGPPGNDLFFPDAFAGDIMFNLAAGFIRAPGNEGDPITQFGNDLENLTLHELGHAAIGLGHPDQGPGDVMYVGPGAVDVINRQLSADDIAGAQFVYGPPPIPGDASLDGLVDGVDYTIWADHFLQTGQTRVSGDFTRDGKVDGADYTVWADHFAPGPLGLTAAAVPEPAGIVLAVVGAVTSLVGVGRRRRRV